MSKASDRAYAQIKAMILSGTLAPGAPLREEQLAEVCGVSRTPVREAMRRLEAELFVRKTETQRSFVVDASPDDIADAGKPCRAPGGGTDGARRSCCAARP